VEHAGGGDADEGQSTADVSSSRMEKEAKAQANVASMMFVELLFWKNQKEAEDVREEYNWRVGCLTLEAFISDTCRRLIWLL